MLLLHVHKPIPLRPVLALPAGHGRVTNVFTKLYQ